jgi:hypothetical protein
MTTGNKGSGHDDHLLISGIDFACLSFHSGLPFVLPQGEEAKKGKNLLHRIAR